jgi:hypothetical protein
MIEVITLGEGILLYRCFTTVLLQLYYRERLCALIER